MPLAQMMVARSSMKTLSPMPRATSWYKKWWVWALVGGGVAITGTVTVLLIRRKRARS
jgi:hypothetical protein